MTGVSIIDVPQPMSEWWFKMFREEVTLMEFFYDCDSLLTFASTSKMVFTKRTGKW